MTHAFTLKNARVFRGEKGFVRGDLSVCDGKIVPEEQTQKQDLNGAFLIPGLVDAHTHGRSGVDFVRADAEQLHRLRLSYAAIGVTTPVPTLASAPFDEWLCAMERIRKAGYPAVHLEGRYLSPAKRGIHKSEWLSAPDCDELRRISRAAGNMRLHITLAPELEGAQSFIRLARSLGYTVGLGHSSADLNQTDRALLDGVNAFTHLFNAMPPLHHRQAGPVCRALTGDSYVELICDGFHIHPDVIALVKKIKAPEQVVLISDSIEAAGCPDGQYSIAGETVTVQNGRALSSDGVIGGSTLELPDAVANYLSFSGADICRGIRCVTENPASMLGMRDLCGGLENGMNADFCILDENFTLQDVYLSGRKIAQISHKSFVLRP